jgi:hypothetical protein
MKSSVPKKLYRKVRKTLLVDSRDRNPTQTQSKYTVTLPKVYENVYSVTLRSAEIPVTWYTFSAALKNTSFEVTHTTTKTITIPDGNYDSTSFVTVMLAALNDPTTGFGTGAFTLTYDDTTLKFTFGTAATAFTFNFPNALPRTAFWGLGYFMGFLNASHTSSGNSLTSDFAAQLSSPNYILMELDFINKEDETSVDSRLSGNVDGCFAKIPISANAGATIFFREVGIPMNRSVLSPPISQLKSLNIKFRDHYGNLIDFNNIDHSLTLEFELLDNNFDEYSSLDFSSLA